MYLVIAKTGNNVYTLHDVRENATAKKLKSGSVAKGINAIDSFTFSIYQNNPAYENLIAYKTQIEVYNIKTLTLEYSGRVLLVKTEMEDDGLIYKDVTCESVMGYLCDSVQPYEVERNWTLNELLTTIIENHNEQVETHKRFNLGEITMTAPNDNIYIGIQRENTWETLTKKLIEKIGGEFAYRIANGNIYLDYKPQIGRRKDTTIALAKNMKSASVEIDPTAFVTRLIPLGAKIEVAEGEPETEERIGIESVNNGVAYVEDTAGVAMYGVITKYEIWEDVHEPAILKTKAENYIAEVNKVLRKYNINAVDLSLIDLDIDSFEVGNYYPVKNALMGIDDELRVVKKTIDIINFTTSNFEIGDSYKTLSDLQKEQEKAIADRLQNAENKFEAVEKLEQDTANASTLAEQARAEALKAQADAEKAQADANTAKANAEQAQNELETAKANLAEVSNKADATAEELEQAKTDLANAQAKADKAEADALKAQNDATTAKQTANEATAKAEQAQEDASNAVTSAGLAKAEADKAVINANEAKTASDEAKLIAGTAIDRADNAIETAETAKSTANTASQTATDAKNDAEQAQKEIDGLGEKITTLETTMTADYARKTDVTEARAELQTQITQNAESITQTASRVTEIDETANNSLELAEQAKEEAELAQSKADLATAGANEAQTVANTAKSTAEQAQTNATNAKTIAEQAQTDATTANTKAEQAQEDAETAKTNATNAQTVANTAKTTAESATAKATTAQTKAEQAQADLETAQAELAEVSSKADATAEELETAKTAVATAQSKADTAKAEAEQAQADANTAKANALTAQEEADKAKADAEKAVADASTAKTNATNAQTVANNAKLEAENAQEVADTAKTNAEQAQTVANLAKTASENAQAVADEAKAEAEQAQADANALKTRVETAETKIEQNSQQLLLMATKAELEETLGGYFTKEETQAQIKLESDSIKSTVSSTYATKTALNTTDTKANTAKETAETAKAEAEEAQTVASTAQSTANTAKSTADTAKQTADATAEELENLEIGGRNLLRFTEQMPISETVRGMDGISKYASYGTLTDTENGVKLEYNNDSSNTGLTIPLVYDGCIANNEEVTVSFLYRGNVDYVGSLYLLQRTTPNVSKSFPRLTISETEWQKCEFTFSHAEANARGCYQLLLFYTKYATGKWLEIKKGSLMLERGNRANDWQPAPEDTSEKLGAIEIRTSSAESQIEQLPASIRAEVQEEYTSKTDTEELRNSMQTVFAQLSDEFVMKFTEIMEQITTVDGKVESNYQELIDYIRFTNGNIILGQVNNELSLIIKKDRISFMQGEIEVAYMSNNKLYITDGEFLNSLVLGNFEFIPRTNGNLSFRKRGGN